MKTLRSLSRIGLVALILSTLLWTASMARPLPEDPKGSVVSDTLSTDQELLLIDVLHTSFQSLSDKSRRGRRIGGYTLIGLGIGSSLGGAATLAFGEGDDARIVGYSLLGGGVLLSGLSLIPFKLRGESERIYAELSRMPADTPAQIHHKYIYWDRRFEELAQKKRKGRIVGGVTSIVAGGVTGLVALKGSEQEDLHTFIWPALGPILGGVSSLLIKSDAERRYETYQRAKGDILGSPSPIAIHIGVAPLPRGRMFGVVLVRF